MMGDVPHSVREKVSQLIYVRVGSNMPPPVRAEDDTDRLEGLLREFSIGGLLLFNGTYGVTGQALSRLQSLSRFPLLVAADLERGAGQQLAGATVFPHAMALSAQGLSGAADAEEIGRITAREALSEGVHCILGPVADVHSNPRNPIISTRAFGSDPAVVAALVAAYVRGCREEGALVAPKHFPGHGDTDMDSHSEVPVIRGGRDRMEGVELVPFRAAIRANCDAIMTAHAVYPDIDDSGVVATASRSIIAGLLRADLGFEGAVITDSLLMAGVRGSYATTGEMAVALLLAGQDLLLDIDDVAGTIDVVVNAVEDGRVPRAVLDRAFRKSWALKERVVRRFGSDVFEKPPPAPTGSEMQLHALKALEVARKGLVVSDTSDTGTAPAAPVPRKPHFVMVRPFRTHLDPSPEPLQALVEERFGAGCFDLISAESEESERNRILTRSNDADSVYVALVAKPAAWQRFGLPEDLKRFVHDLVGDRGHEVTVAAFGAQEIFDVVPPVRQRVCTFSDVEASQRAAFERIVGLQDHQPDPTNGNL